MILCASPQALALGRQRSGILRQAHFITTSKTGLSEPSWMGKLKIILSPILDEVNKIPLGHQSDNVSESGTCTVGARAY